MITQEEYKSRRQRLAGEQSSNSLAIIPAAKEFLRNGDTHYRFRQNSDFLYLTGFNEPNAILLIYSGEQNKTILFNQFKNPDEERWTGIRLGQKAAVDFLGMTEAYPIDEFRSKLPQLLSKVDNLYFSLGCYPELEQQLSTAVSLAKKMVRRGIAAPSAMKDLSPILSEMRLFKSPAEIALMKKAGKISTLAHRRAMKTCKHLSFEYQLEAEITYEFMKQGCRNAAYDSIVGGGKNACILHYTSNDAPLNPKDLVLIDAGAEYQGYAADITRTFPIGGQFSGEQKAVYELVLSAQQEGIKRVKPGVKWNEVQTTIVRILTEGLCELGLLKGEVSALIETMAYRKFYMHNSGHWLGLDVHDSGAYKIADQWRPFEPGMVLTVEPGIYISPETEGVDERWWNIGVRIEDDILVTSTGRDNLTADVPVDPAEIEALMRE